MIRPRHILPLTVPIILCLSAVTLGGQTLKELLLTLDGEMSKAEQYVSQKESRIRVLEGILENGSIGPEEYYSTLSLLYDEYFSFKYEEAERILDRMDSLAGVASDGKKKLDVLFKRALLSTVGGNYLEARNCLEKIDSSSLAGQDALRYLNICQRFWTDYADYLYEGEEAKRDKIKRAAVYQDKILSMVPPSSVEGEKILVQKLTHSTDTKDFQKADSVNRALILKLGPQTHDYAIQAYYQALISEALGREEDRRMWLARSATTDIQTATKDNASAINLAKLLFADGDIDRAFRYSMFSLNDANFYDAYLRQWQISAIFPSIQESYSKLLQEQGKKDRRRFFVISVLALATLAALGFVLLLYKRQSEDRKKMERMNKALTQANTAKDQYLGLFLSMCSNYIGKMKGMQSSVRKKLLSEDYDELLSEVSSHKLIDSELQEFYNVFDQSFLKLYPNFVKEFNNLLQEDKRIILKEGELLNTELRIFALIRLGITQSSSIASFLRFSPNTIYNYRAQVKNAALGDRETFEQRVREIGGNL